MDEGDKEWIPHKVLDEKPGVYVMEMQVISYMIEVRDSIPFQG